MDKTQTPNVYMETGEKKIFIEERAVSVMLDEDILFLGMHDDNGIDLIVNCNDLFYPCADAIELEYDEIENLYTMTRKKWGREIWCCKKRRMQPQKPIKEIMINDGVWDDELEKLGDHDL